MGTKPYLVKDKAYPANPMRCPLSKTCFLPFGMLLLRTEGAYRPFDTVLLLRLPTPWRCAIGPSFLHCTTRKEGDFVGRIGMHHNHSPRRCPTPLYPLISSLSQAISHIRHTSGSMSSEWLTRGKGGRKAHADTISLVPHRTILLEMTKRATQSRENPSLPLSLTLFDVGVQRAGFDRCGKPSS